MGNCYNENLKEELYLELDVQPSRKAKTYKILNKTLSLPAL